MSVFLCEGKTTDCIGMNKETLYLLLFGLLLRQVQTTLACGSEMLITCGTHECPELMHQLEKWEVATFNITINDSIKSSPILVDTFDLRFSAIFENGTVFPDKGFKATVEIDNCGIKIKLTNYNCSQKGMIYCDCVMVSRAENQTGETTERVTGTLLSKVGVFVFLLITGLLIVRVVVYSMKRQNKKSKSRTEIMELVCPDLTARPKPGDCSPKDGATILVGPNVTRRPTPGDYSQKYGEGRLYYVLKNKWQDDLKRMERKLKVRRDLEDVAEKLHLWCNTMDAEC